MDNKRKAGNASSSAPAPKRARLEVPVQLDEASSSSGLSSVDEQDGSPALDDSAAVEDEEDDGEAEGDEEEEGEAEQEEEVEQESENEQNAQDSDSNAEDGQAEVEESEDDAPLSETVPANLKQGSNSMSGKRPRQPGLYSVSSQPSIATPEDSATPEDTSLLVDENEPLSMQKLSTATSSKSLSRGVASGKQQKKSSKGNATSQKGVGMARTVVPTEGLAAAGNGAVNRTNESSPEISLSHIQARHRLAMQAEQAAAHQDQQEALAKVKAEENDDDHLNALISGVPIDPNAPPTLSEHLGLSTANPSLEKERPAIAEERARIIVFHQVSNSEIPLTPAKLIILTGLKNIFQKQLPKMPREYIARLVFDREHWSMAIVKRGYQVVGGITYRPFQQRGFAEIVFCAITGTEQVRGYGSHLMNHLKDYVRSAHPGIEHFLTYADNYAVGYFKKQGFTKEITLDRALWAAYIKDYEGGTIMQCSMIPRVQYLDARELLLKQKEIILAKIRLVSRSHIVYRGRDIFPDDQPRALEPSDVPGLRDAGWNPTLDELSRKPQRGPQHMIMQRLLTDMTGHPSAWPFLKPVNKEEVQDYYDVIKNPMDLETMEYKLDANQYSDLQAFLKDAQYIFDNCRTYNAETSNYAKNATKLEKFLKERTKVYVEAE